MKIIKVFLAKSHLAGGLDVEFVKSSLMKVANLAIVESGSRIKPSECEVFIYIPGEEDFKDEINVTVNKIVGLKLQNFVSKDTHKKHLYIVLGIDVHKERVLCDRVKIDDLSDKFDSIALEECFDDMGVDIIAEICNIFPYLNFTSIRKAPLRHTPSDNYALPPIPSVDKRMLGRYNMKNLDVYERPSKRKKK